MTALAALFWQAPSDVAIMVHCRNRRLPNERMSRPLHASIRTHALHHNAELIRSRAPHSRMLAMVKADAYGHGLETVVRALPQADAFGVAALSEARRIRAIGSTVPIVLMSGPDHAEDLAELRQLSVACVIHHPDQVALLEQAPAGPPLHCWLKIDTGMHRLGIAPEDAHAIHARLSACAAVHSELVFMTHFASSDETDLHTRGGAMTLRQLQLFEQVTAGLPGLRSLANSAAILDWPQTHADWVRPGGALYGMSVAAGKPGPDYGLQPVMQLDTRLLSVKTVRGGERVGYSSLWEAPEDMPIGVAAVGYGDGYPRLAPSGMPVLLEGQPVPLIGRVSMDMIALDLRERPQARVGDAVRLWGDGLPVDTVAAHCDTIGYALTCAVTGRVPRVPG